MQNYNALNDVQKIDVLTQEYLQAKHSIQEIAAKYDTYSNKVRRDLKKFNIPIRSKSEAQKNALKSGKAEHPTQGKQRDEETKRKIGENVMRSWENMSKSELKRRQVLARDNWEKLSEEEKTFRLNAANAAVRESSKSGSKLEKFLLESLMENGYKVEFHKEHHLLDTNLQIDIFLPSLNIAVEVDGPSHFSPVWGEETYRRNVEYDKKKHGLLIGKGIALVRVKQTKDFSKSRAHLLSGKLMEAIADIKTKGYNFIEIGDE